MEEADSHSEELFSMDDLKIEVMRSRGAGGQVNYSLFLSQPFEYPVFSMSTKPSLQCDSLTSQAE
jgi:hypothetical protein